MRRPAQYYEQERRRGLRVSLTLHLLFLLLAYFGLPDFLSPKPPEEPAAITVELLPITGITNVKPADKPISQEPKPEKEEQKTPPKPTPPVKTAEDTPPPPPPPEPKKSEKKDKPEPKKPEEKKDEKKNKPKPQDLDAVLKAVKDTAQKEKKDDKKDKKDTSAENKSISNQYNPELPMSMSEKDAIRSQIAKCWNVPAGAKDAHELVVVLRIQLEQDGTVTKVELASESKSRYGTDTFFRAAADSAMRAVRQCSPLKNLPPEKFQTWKDMELTFDPKEMLF